MTRQDLKSASLMQDVQNDEGGRVETFDPFRIRPFKNQIRKQFLAIPELANSIKECGQATPIKVRLITHKKYDAELVDGERRLRACRLIEHPIQAFIDTGITDEKTQFAHCVAANFGRQDHNCLEIAHAIERFVEDGKTQTAIAAIFGKTQSWVSQHLRLLRLVPEVQELLVPPSPDESPPKLEDGDGDSTTASDSTTVSDRAVIPFSVALLLVPLSDDLQRSVAQHLLHEGMSMIAARRYINQMMRVNGESHRARRRSSSEMWGALSSLSGRARDMFGSYLDMKGPEFDHVLRNASSKDRKSLAASLHELSKEITLLAESVEQA